MVYIYRKVVGKKPYYYLRISERKGKRVISKDVAYLGNEIEDVKKNLANLSSYKEEIRRAHKTITSFLESNYYLEKVKLLKLRKDDFLKEKIDIVESCKLHYNKVFLKKDILTKNETLNNFLIDFAFNTTSMEGNTINLLEARNLLQEGLTPKDKTLREIYDLQNTKRVFFETLDFRKKISHNFIIRIHKGLMEKIDTRGGYRNTEVRVIRSNFDATPSKYVKSDMEILLKWYEENENKLHPLVFASVFHHKFEKIHPFMDGNGRTGRILLNYILMSKNYPPIIIRNKVRKDYLNTMRIADKSTLTSLASKDYSNLARFNAEEMANSYWSIFL